MSFIVIFALNHPSEGVKMRNSPVARSYSGRIHSSLLHHYR